MNQLQRLSQIYYKKLIITMCELIGSSENITKRMNGFQNAKDPKRCRICLDQEGQLLSLPCSCKNELGLIHQTCFAKWAETVHPNLTKSIVEINCEICTKSMKIGVQTKTRLKNCTQIKKRHSNCQMITAFISMGVIGFLIYLCIRGIISVEGGFFIMYIVYGVVIIFLLVVLKVVIQLTIRIFKKTQIVTLKFLSKAEPEKIHS